LALYSRKGISPHLLALLRVRADDLHGQAQYQRGNDEKHVLPTVVKLKFVIPSNPGSQSVARPGTQEFLRTLDAGFHRHDGKT